MSRVIVDGRAWMVLFCLAWPSIARGAWVVDTNTNIRLFDGPGNVNAGEFIVKTDQVSDNFQTERFRTFCVQVNEFLNLGETLDIFGISYQSQLGGISLSARTSALYRAFIDGYYANVGSTNFFGNASASYTFNQGNGADASLLQKAIWQYQGQINTETIGNNKFVDAVEALATTKGWAAGMLATSLSGSDLASFGGVRILNLYRTVNGNQVHAQDQLYYDPQLSSVVTVPEPAMLSLFAWGGLGMWYTARRRRRRISRA